VKTSANVTTIFGALITVQSALQDAKKNAVNPHFKNKYADYASIVGTAKPLLISNGIGFSQTFDDAPAGMVTIITTLMHTSGEWIQSRLTLPGGADPQKYGSAITYGRRYALSAILGMVTDDDDDANAASLPEQPRSQQARSSARTQAQAGAPANQAPAKKTAVQLLAEYAQKQGIDPASPEYLLYVGGLATLKKRSTKPDAADVVIKDLSYVNERVAKGCLEQLQEQAKMEVWGLLANRGNAIGDPEFMADVRNILIGWNEAHDEKSQVKIPATKEEISPAAYKILLNELKKGQASG